MTRLTQNDLNGLELDLCRYDEELLRLTGLTLGQLACMAAGVSEKELSIASNRIKVAVIPVTTGEGIIPGFVGSVLSIIKHLGFAVQVTEKSDLSGFCEAVSGTDLIFMADDQKFMALNLRNSKLVDNAEATARGYVTALNCLGQGLAGQTVLVVGAGEVGSKAISYLREIGAEVTICEVNQDKAADLRRANLKVIKNIVEELPNFQFIIDASPQAEFLKLSNLHPEVRIAAPGIPLGLTGEAYQVLRERIVHDPLQIGVATMVAMAIAEDRSQKPEVRCQQKSEARGRKPED